MPTKSSHVTIDHDEIREWAEARCGRPSMVTGTGSEDHAGILRIDFPGYGGRGTLEPISWEEFFAKFEESNLALVYSAHAHGHRSNFNKLIARESVDLETGEKVGLSRHRRKQAEQAGAKRTPAKKAGTKAATPRRTTRSTPAMLGERRAPRSAAARTVLETKGRSSQRGGARQDPARRGPSRGTRSPSR
ncbi:hypothetical protein JRI60_01760 [Archangium violaceum]|uniref:hypothetical protein n=1 Tax=Archangium violaceum TaxID=83451 RepID=UPI0019507D04|nr:hypothetical protein [Archangium violaceum]QRN97836.1 hypothetical protein JRI60_01760 [Archangium violaceum]